MRSVPKKNYIILFVIMIVVVVICFLFMNMYNANKKEVYDSVIKDVINEIKVEDLENYLQENPDVVLYINDRSHSNKKLEEKVKKVIVDDNIQQYFIYIERSDDIVKKYNLDDNSPIFIAYKNGEQVEVLSQSEYSIKEIESFLIRNGVIEHD